MNKFQVCPLVIRVIFIVEFSLSEDIGSDGDKLGSNGYSLRLNLYPKSIKKILNLN